MSGGTPKTCEAVRVWMSSPRRESVDVSGLQLRKLAVFQHHARNGVILSEIFQHVDRGGDHLTLTVLHGLGQVELVEKHVAEFFRRVDVELDARFAINVFCL